MIALATLLGSALFAAKPTAVVVASDGCARLAPALSLCGEVERDGERLWLEDSYLVLATSALPEIVRRPLEEEPDEDAKPVVRPEGGWPAYLRLIAFLGSFDGARAETVSGPGGETRLRFSPSHPGDFPEITLTIPQARALVRAHSLPPSAVGCAPLGKEVSLCGAQSGQWEDGLAGGFCDLVAGEARASLSETLSVSHLYSVSKSGKKLHVNYSKSSADRGRVIDVSESELMPKIVAAAASAAFERGDNASAEKGFQRALARDPKNTELAVRLARAQARQKKIDDAAHTLAAQVARSPVAVYAALLRDAELSPLSSDPRFARIRLSKKGAATAGDVADGNSEVRGRLGIVAWSRSHDAIAVLEGSDFYGDESESHRTWLVILDTRTGAQLLTADLPSDADQAGERDPDGENENAHGGETPAAKEPSWIDRFFADLGFDPVTDATFDGEHTRASVPGGPTVEWTTDHVESEAIYTAHIRVRAVRKKKSL